MEGDTIVVLSTWSSVEDYLSLSGNTQVSSAPTPYTRMRNTRKQQQPVLDNACVMLLYVHVKHYRYFI